MTFGSLFAVVPAVAEWIGRRIMEADRDLA